MPVTIGKKLESDFSNPIGMLGDCHRRIERFLAGLIAIAEQARGGSIPPAHREQFAAGLRYFREAAPNHTLDEEESLFPRLLEHKDSHTRAVLDTLTHLETQHIRARDRHSIVDRLGGEWLSQGALSPTDFDLLITNLHELRSDYQEHITFEDQTVFPLAAEVLNPEELAAVGLEMASRRGLRKQEQ
jgi:hemerythrin-like domain-containing protein